MNCEEVKKYIGAFLEGDLSTEEENNFKVHTEACPHCREEVEAHKKTWQMLEQWEDMEPSPSFTADFWKAVEKDPEASSIGAPSWWQVFSETVASAFTYRVPAWGVIALLMVAIFAGHFTFPRVEERVVIKEVPKIQVVYQQIPGDLIASLPSSTLPDAADSISTMSEIVNESDTAYQVEDLPTPPNNIDTDPSLNRIDLDFLLDGKKS